MSEVQSTEKDRKRMREMAATVRLHPDKAAEFLNFAYGLGYCQGSITTAQKILELTPDAAPSPSTGEKK